MSLPDIEATRLHPLAVAALRRGDAIAALQAAQRHADPAALRVTGRALLALGDRDGARRALTDALASAEIDRIGAAVAHEALAAVAKAVGEPAEAVGHLEQALTGAPKSDQAGLHREAAALASRAGMLVSAERHALRSLELEQAAAAADPGPAAGPQGPYAVLIAADRARLGSILSARDRHEEAIEHLAQAVDDLECALGRWHVEVLAVRSELAETLRAGGHGRDAERAYREVLAGRKRTLGPDHREVAVTLLALSGIGAERDDAVAARAWGEQALAVLDGRVGTDHPLMVAASAAAAGGPDT